MIQMLRKESSSGNIDDLAHVRTEFCLADCLTKNSAKPGALLKAVSTGILKTIDEHPAFRSLLKHKAYLASWIVRNIKESSLVETFLALPVALLNEDRSRSAASFATLVKERGEHRDGTSLSCAAGRLLTSAHAR